MKKTLLSLVLLFVGALAFSQEKQAEIEFVTTTHDFGTVVEGEKPSFDFVFKNTGDAPLVLTSVNPGCGCTIPTWPKEPIMPGQTAKITALYNSAGRGTGNFSKSITVASNAKTGTLLITIKGNVVPKPGSESPEKPAPQH